MTNHGKQAGKVEQNKEAEEKSRDSSVEEQKLQMLYTNEVRCGKLRISQSGKLAQSMVSATDFQQKVESLLSFLNVCMYIYGQDGRFARGWLDIVEEGPQNIQNHGKTHSFWGFSLQKGIYLLGETRLVLPENKHNTG